MLTFILTWINFNYLMHEMFLHVQEQYESLYELPYLYLSRDQRAEYANV